MAVDMAVITLRRLWSPKHKTWKWTGATFQDQIDLRRCGAAAYFTDDEYDHVLDLVSVYGVALETPYDDDLEAVSNV